MSLNKTIGLRSNNVDKFSWNERYRKKKGYVHTRAKVKGTFNIQCYCCAVEAAHVHIGTHRSREQSVLYRSRNKNNGK